MRWPLVARAVSTALLAALALSTALASPRRTKTPRPRTPSPTPTVAPTPPPPKPATLIPNPPYVGTPSTAAPSYAGVLRAKEAGATEAQLLELVAKEGRPYSLSTPDLQKLRAAGVSSKVIEAMLRSDRTPLPRITASTAPAPATPAATTPASR
jgi:hypothetical protein